MEEDQQTKFWRKFGELYLEHVKVILVKSDALIVPAVFSVLAQHLKAVFEGYEYITYTESAYNDIHRLDNKMHELKMFAKGHGYSDDIKLIPSVFIDKKSGEYCISSSYYVYAKPVYSNDGIADAQIINDSGLEERVMATAQKLL